MTSTVRSRYRARGCTSNPLVICAAVSLIFGATAYIAIRSTANGPDDVARRWDEAFGSRETILQRWPTRATNAAANEFERTR
jgi:hypothetical protein